MPPNALTSNASNPFRNVFNASRIIKLICFISAYSFTWFSAIPFVNILIGNYKAPVTVFKNLTIACRIVFNINRNKLNTDVTLTLFRVFGNPQPAGLQALR